MAALFDFCCVGGDCRSASLGFPMTFPSMMGWELQRFGCWSVTVCLWTLFSRPDYHFFRAEKQARGSSVAKHQYPQRSDKILYPISARRLKGLLFCMPGGVTKLANDVLRRSIRVASALVLSQCGTASCGFEYQFGFVKLGE